ncbi:MFS general substrate transporter [Cystobasidium minutum MCA 4210]|uniref:MFS general substrate transporter n=1 Tax=Cystobasidium minutum MCA 4210 TaxID=1397322 RepID=UPI0034CD51F7|eukprot:jgi/Rhomi1/168675/fgenesh1_kg.3_\
MSTQTIVQHQEAHELTALPARETSTSRPSSITSSSRDADEETGIPAADSSRQAYKFLLASFVVECLVWSFPNAYGIFFDYYITNTPLGSESNAQFLLSLAGTCQSGFMYCSSPFVFYLQRRYPKYFQHTLWAGAIMHSISLILTSFANAPYQIVLLQGILYAMGGTLLAWSSFALIPEWFVRRRGLASGVCFAGTSVGGIFLPFLITLLLNKYGERVTLRALGVSVFILLAPVIPFIKRRVPYTSPKSSAYRRPKASTSTSTGGSKAWWKDEVLWLFSFATIAQALGFFITVLYLPNFASSLGLKDIEGTTALAVLNACGTISRLGAGMLADYLSPFRVAAVSLSLSSLTVFLLWGLASTNFGALMAFSAVFGLVATGFTSLASGVIKHLAGEDASRNVMLFGVLTFTRGVGNILTSPVSSALVKDPKSPLGPRLDTIYSTTFGSVVIFSGVTLVVAGAMSLWASILQSRRKKVE